MSASDIDEDIEVSVNIVNPALQSTPFFIE